MISILVPSRTDAYIDRLIASFKASQPDWRRMTELIVADDGLSEACRQRHPEAMFVLCPIPFIFARNVNLAAESASGHLFILNDDTRIVSANFVGALESVVNSDVAAGYGVLGARVLRNTGNLAQTQPVPAGEIHEIAPTPENLQGTLPFIAVLIPRTIWREVGRLDEQFDGYGWEDNDYAMRVREAGYRLGIFGGVSVDHERHGTFRVYEARLDEMCERSRQRFDSKWGKGKTNRVWT